MKKFILFAFVVTAFTVTLNGQNLIVNGDFETGDKSGWSGFSNGITLETDDVLNNSNQCYEGTTSGRVNNGEGSLFQDVVVEAGESYTLTFIGKLRDAGQSFSPAVRDKGGDNALLNSTLVNSNVWNSYTIQFTPNSTLARVVFYKVNGVSPFYLDNVVLEKDVSTSLGSVNKNSLSVYPNPATDYITINSEEVIKSYKIYSSTGQLVTNESVNTATLNVDISTYSAGMYLLSTTDNNGAVVVTKVYRK